MTVDNVDTGCWPVLLGLSADVERALWQMGTPFGIYSVRAEGLELSCEFG